MIYLGIPIHNSVFVEEIMMKKRLLLFCTLVIMMFSFTGCGGQTLTEYEQQNESSNTAATENDATTDTLTAQHEAETQKPETVSV